MHARNEIRLTYYRYAGKFLGFRIRSRCQECDLTYALLQQLLADVFRGRPVSLVIKPWLDNWWRVIWRGAWHAPILLVNGRLFSQGGVPDVPRLLRTIGRLLDDRELIRAAEVYAVKQPPPENDHDLVVFASPACPHCVQLTEYLKLNQISFAYRDVSRSATARQQLEALTGRLTIPVVQAAKKVVVGFDPAALRELLGIAPSEERSLPQGHTPPHPVVSAEALSRAVDAAKRVLRENQFDGRTRASADHYPHQWNWDAGFIARGYLHFDPPQAYRELRKLFEAQWSDGFLPHIVFNPAALDHFPGPDYWQARRSGRVPPEVEASGISQPPVHASMLVAALELDPDQPRAHQALAELYPKIRRLHDYFFTYRDPRSEGLVCLVHPWESGLDNTPLWDEPLARITRSSPWAKKMQRRHDVLAAEGKRPRRAYFEKYSYLVERLFRLDYDWRRVVESHPFLIQDVLFNTILCQAERDLATIAAATGHDDAVHLERARRMARAINRKLWSESRGVYESYDVLAKRPIDRETAFSYLPLYAEVCDPQRGERVIDHLCTHCFCVAERACSAVPSYDMCVADYQGEFYWRGPAWFNINWYLAKGLRNYGQDDRAQWIEDSLLKLATEHGFWEYYSPETGKGLGAGRFSWTAALFLDLACRRS